MYKTSCQSAKILNHIQCQQPDLVFLSETWLNSEVDNYEGFLFMDLYVFIRSDTKIGSHAGIIVAYEFILNQLITDIYFCDSSASFITNDYALTSLFFFILCYNPPKTHPFPTKRTCYAI